MERDDRTSLYYVSLIAWVGCHIDAYEQAKWFGDDLALKGDSTTRDMTGRRGFDADQPGAAWLGGISLIEQVAASLVN